MRTSKKWVGLVSCPAAPRATRRTRRRRAGYPGTHGAATRGTQRLRCVPAPCMPFLQESVHPRQARDRQRLVVRLIYLPQPKTLEKVLYPSAPLHLQRVILKVPYHSLFTDFLSLASIFVLFLSSTPARVGDGHRLYFLLIAFLSLANALRHSFHLVLVLTPLADPDQ